MIKPIQGYRYTKARESSQEKKRLLSSFSGLAGHSAKKAKLALQTIEGDDGDEIIVHDGVRGTLVSYF